MTDNKTTEAATPLSPEEQKLADLRAKRQALEDASAARKQSREVAEAIELETRAISNLEAIQKAEAEHGLVGKTLRVMDTENGVVIVKKPNMVMYRRFQDKGSFTSDDCDPLVKNALVHPDKATFDRWIDEYPGILVPITNLVCELAGATVKERSGK